MVAFQCRKVWNFMRSGQGFTNFLAKRFRDLQKVTFHCHVGLSPNILVLFLDKLLSISMSLELTFKIPGKLSFFGVVQCYGSILNVNIGAPKPVGLTNPHGSFFYVRIFEEMRVKQPT